MGERVNYFLVAQVAFGLDLLLNLDLLILKKYLFLLMTNLRLGAVMWSSCWSCSTRSMRVNCCLVMHLIHLALILKVQSLLR